jgi:ribosomal protein S26
MPVIADQYFEEHSLERDPDTGEVDRREVRYRECIECGRAIHKSETVLMTYNGRFLCNAKCARENETKAIVARIAEWKAVTQ